MPKGRRTLISPQFACFTLTPPRTSEAVKSSARTSGTANCSGCESASRGTEMRADPKPVMPRMKYALIRMQSTSTMSAKANSLNKGGSAQLRSMAPGRSDRCPVNVVLQSRPVCTCLSSTNRGFSPAGRSAGAHRRGGDATTAGSGPPEGGQGLGDQRRAFGELEASGGEVAGLCDALDLGEQVAHRHGAKLAAGAFQGMSGAHGGACGHAGHDSRAHGTAY